MKVSASAFEDSNRIHYLKTRKPYFGDVWDKRKLFELRVSDRDFRVGDTLWLNELTEERTRYTGRIVTAEVLDVFRAFPGLELGYVIMSIRVLDKFKGIGPQELSAYDPPAPLTTRAAMRRSAIDSR